MRGKCSAAWRFALLIIVGQACVSFATEEAAGEDMAVHVVAEAGGDFPTQEMRLKTDAIERGYLAKQKIVAEHKEKKWQQKVLRVKVNHLADAEVKKRSIRKAEAMKRIDKLQARRFQAMNANLDLQGEKDRVQQTLIEGSLLHERSKKTAYSLSVAVKKTEELKNGEGIEALSDRGQVGAMEAKLRIAEAHADGSIKGLTKWQRKDTPSALLHAAVETAVGTPTHLNVDLANDQLHDTAKSIHEKEWKRIDELKEKYKVKAANEAQEKEDAASEAKHKTEVGQKSEAEKKGKQEEGMSAHIELPHKKRVENMQKKRTQQLIDHWSAHEQRVSDELGVKGNMRTIHMKYKEGTEKEKAASLEKIFKAECLKTEATKVSALEVRGKKIGVFEQARQGLIDAQNDLNNRKTTIDEQKLSDEEELGESSKVGTRPVRLATDQARVREWASYKQKSGKHSRNLLFFGLFGGGDKGPSEGDVKMSVAKTNADAKVAIESVKTKEVSRKATYEKSTKSESSQKDEAREKADVIEKNRETSTKALEAAAEKAAKEAVLLSDERASKARLKKAEKDSHFAEEEMQEANQKAATADTANRKCEGNAFRRRRTCACDDALQRREAMEEEELELGEGSESGGDVTEWVRRRYSTKTARRRKIGNDAVRLPTSVCPCCPPLKAGETKSTACQLADAKKEETDKIMSGGAELGDRAPNRYELQHQSPAFVPPTLNQPKFSYQDYEEKMQNAVKHGDYITAGMMQEELKKFHSPETSSVMHAAQVTQMEAPEVVMPDIAKMHKKAESIVAGEIAGDEDNGDGAFDQYRTIKISPDEADLGESVSGMREVTDQDS